MAKTFGAVLAIDYGQNRTGLAISRQDTNLAVGLTTVKTAEIYAQLERLIKEMSVKRLIVGYPRGMNGQTTNQTKEVELFIKELASRFKIPIDTQDESLTSLKAENELIKLNKNYTKADIDQLAAVYILEDWLNDNTKVRHN